MIRAANLSKEYGGRRVVDNVSLEVAAGECLVLSGDPASGAATLLRMLATLVRPTEGTLTIAGITIGERRVRKDPASGPKDTARRSVIEARRHVAFAATECVTPGLRVDEYLRLISRARHVAATAGENSRAALLSAAHVDGRSSVDALSPLQRRMLAVAAAMSIGADAVLLDDPLADASAEMHRALIASLQDARQRGAALVVRTNDAAATTALRARHLLVRAGRID